MNKTCNKCGASVPADQKFCTSCGGNEFTEAAAVQPTVAPVQPAVAPVAGAQPPKKGMPTWLKVILIILLVLGLMGACTVGCVVMTGKAIVDSANEALEDLESDLGDYDYDYDYDYDDEEDTSTDTGVYGFDESFDFDELELTIGSDYKFTTVTNSYDSHYGKDVVKVPVTVTNNSSDSHGLNMFYYTIYGPNGTKVDNMATLFYFDNDDVLDYAGDLLSGASYTNYLYFIYDGDGTYTIEFDNYSEEVTAEFEITK